LTASGPEGGSGTSSKASEPGTPDEDSYKIVGKAAVRAAEEYGDCDRAKWVAFGGSTHARWTFIDQAAEGGSTVTSLEKVEGRATEPSYAAIDMSMSRS
jgi:hypothetical protein